MEKGIVCLLSGGVDSTTCLAKAVSEVGSENVLAVIADYGQKHKQEIDCALKICDFYNVEYIIINLREIFKNSKTSLIEANGKEIPKGSYADQLKEGEIDTYVPFRNGVLLSIAGSIALQYGASYVMYGAHQDDVAGDAYPDCSLDFCIGIGNALEEGTGGKIRLYAPYVGRTKADIVKEGLELGVPYELTRSCYEGGDKPCGKCGTCIDRAKAFEANGVKDPAL